MFKIEKAVRGQRKLKAAISGLPGSGKTMTALGIAKALGRTCLIDTENKSASIYGDHFNFEVLPLDDLHPDTFLAAIEHVVAQKYDVIIVDSFSHQWQGILDLVDSEALRRGSENTFGEWRFATPKNVSILRALLAAPSHVIVTMRLDQKYAVETNSKGKAVPKKIGLAPKQKENTEYEWDVCLRLDKDHNARVEKTRYPEVEGRYYKRPGEQLGIELLAVISRGVAVPIEPPKPVTPPAPAPIPSTPEPARQPPESAQALADMAKTHDMQTIADLAKKLGKETSLTIAGKRSNELTPEELPIVRMALNLGLKMQKHDWFSDRSDDIRTSSEGRKNLAAIRSELGLLPEAIADRLWGLFAPRDCAVSRENRSVTTSREPGSDG